VVLDYLFIVTLVLGELFIQSLWKLMTYLSSESLPLIRYPVIPSDSPLVNESLA